MLNQLEKLRSQKSERGFTIIEVMIVLAIAGLIILVVLLAVPALQRNARNTTLKSDASSVAAAITEYESNNSGSLPAYVGNNNTTTLTVGSSSSDPNAVTTKVQAGDAITGGTTAPATGNAGTITAVFKAACPGETVGTTRSTAIYYGVETSGTHVQLECIDA
jgi:prepilin-type N-terminal cleavage/methylation domain-containing protein